MNAQSHGDPRPYSWGQVFNLFRRQGSDLVCAVPLDRPVPAFLDDRWGYFCVADAACVVPGFDYSSVAAGAGRYGFRLFRTGSLTARVVH